MLSNEILWILLLAVNFVGILLAYRLFGLVGLFSWIALATLIANIQVSKTIELFGLTATLGNIVYAGTFLATDIISERYGPKVARRAVWLGFFAIVVATGLMQLALLFVPAPSDTMHEGLAAVFSVLPRIAGASLLAYVVSQRHDVWAFQFWKNRFPGPLWLRNNMSTIVSQLIDSVIFTIAAFLGVFPTLVLVEIIVSTYLLKAAVAILDTPFLYIAVHWIKRPPRCGDDLPGTEDASADGAQVGDGRSADPTKEGTEESNAAADESAN